MVSKVFTYTSEILTMNRQNYINFVNSNVLLCCKSGSRCTCYEHQLNILYDIVITFPSEIEFLGFIRRCHAINTSSSIVGYCL